MIESPLVTALDYGTCTRTLCEQKAALMWATFTKSERKLVQIGLVPAWHMTAAVREGFGCEESVRLLTGALLECAQREKTKGEVTA